MYTFLFLGWSDISVFLSDSPSPCLSICSGALFCVAVCILVFGVCFWFYLIFLSQSPNMRKNLYIDFPWKYWLFCRSNVSNEESNWHILSANLDAFENIFANTVSPAVCLSLSLGGLPTSPSFQYNQHQEQRKSTFFFGFALFSFVGFSLDSCIRQAFVFYN